MRWVIKWLVLLMALCATAGCKGSSPQDISSDPAHPIALLEGTVIAKSDVMSKPDQALADQLVLIFPEATSASLFGEKMDAAKLRFTHKKISLQNTNITSAVTDKAGHFRFSLAPGSYVVCLADAESANTALTRGCAPVQLSAGKGYQVKISSGFGEILIEK